MEHEDLSQDQALIIETLQPIVTVIQQMLDKMSAMDEEIDSLAKLVNEEIIGGITTLYKSKQRMSCITDLQGKYGELMGPYKDFYTEITDGDDIYEKLYEELEEYKEASEDGEVDDAKIDEKVKELAEILKSKFNKIKGLGVSVEVSKEEPKELEGSEKILEKVKAMKAKAGDNFKF
jgi:DNA repair ATPase RecN